MNWRDRGGCQTIFGVVLYEGAQTAATNHAVMSQAMNRERCIPTAGTSIKKESNDEGGKTHVNEAVSLLILYA